jgi:hypothetical protein
MLQNFMSGDGTVVYMLASQKIPYMILVSTLTPAHCYRMYCYHMYHAHFAYMY